MEKLVPVSNSVPWSQVCKMLDKVQSSPRETKKEMLLKFVNQYRIQLRSNKNINPQASDTFFPVMRVLLPALDRARGAYGIKERKLADLYIRILGLKKDGVDAKKLLNFKKPKSGGAEAGDFAETAYYVLKNRCPDKGNLTLHGVDEQLTSMAENYGAKNHEEIDKSILVMLRTMTATEQKWLMRVLLKDMKLGLGQTSIFNAWHLDAKDYYDVTNCLEKVCLKLCDPQVRLHEIEVSLFAPFRPMLADRAVIEKVESQMSHKQFYVETKYDGERSQIHKKGNKYMYFSRNCFDFTTNFGADPRSGIFTPYVHGQFLPHIDEIILDGEMVVWSQKYNTIISKGEHVDVKNLREGGDTQVCLCIFDILYLNGQVLTNLPLNQRLDKIKSVIRPKEGRVIITERSIVNSKEDVIKALNEAIDDREEGVVLKDPDSVYRPAARKGGWIKVKPEYVDSLVPELDLLIVGGYYGKGKRRGLSHFLLAVAVDPQEPGGKPTEFHSVGRVGSGYSVAELGELLARLDPNQTSRQPSNVQVSRERPDVWFNPIKSQIVQVRAAELTKSDMYRTGVTLRFPRVEKVRDDKSWYEVMTTSELEDLVKEASGKLATKHYIDGGEESPSKRKAVPRFDQPSLPMHFRPADLSQIVKKGELFSGLEFCVISGNSDHSKQELETLVAVNGGTFTQHPSKNTYAIITKNINIKVQNCITSNNHNVIRPTWLLDCANAMRLLPWGPLEVIHLQDEERQRMRELFDEYGDSYCEPTDEGTLKRILENIDIGKHITLSTSEKCEIDEEIREVGDLDGLFRRVVAFSPPQTDSSGTIRLSLLSLQLYGGSVVQKLNGDVSHIIIADGVKYDTRPSETKRRHLVTTEWIEKCIKEGKLLEERQYIPMCF